MLAASVGVVLVIATLVWFAIVGFRTRGADLDVEEYVVARNSQRTGVLGLSFLASGMGAWILFAPPEIGAFIGVVGIAGYALGAAAPILAFGLLGRRMRVVVPAGHSLTEFVRVRYGRAVHLLVVAVSVGYMFFFLTAELTAVGAVTGILSGVDPRVPVLAVAAVTIAYTTYGGLRASLRTDRWQAWLVMALLGAGAVVLAVLAPSGETPPAGARDLLTVDRLGLEVALTLIIAVTTANLFHQGYWQRVWAAADPRTLQRGATVGALVTVPVVAVVGVLGMLAADRGLVLGDPPAPFFALLADAPAWLGAAVIVLAVALVASSVDTLENGLASLVVAERPTLSLPAARAVTVVLMVPAAFVAVQGYSVLRLFLIADLLCAAIVVPAVAGLWARTTPAGALAGSAAGLVGTVLPGWLSTGSLTEGVWLATFPEAVPTLPPFAGALVAAGLVTAAVSLMAGGRADLEAVGRQVARQTVGAPREG